MGNHPLVSFILLQPEITFLSRCFQSQSVPFYTGSAGDSVPGDMILTDLESATTSPGHKENHCINRPKTELQWIDVSQARGCQDCLFSHQS